MTSESGSITDSQAHSGPTCPSCSGRVDRGLRADEGVFHCSGLCNEAYHGKCLGVTQTSRREMSKNPQILWVCPSCAELMGEIGPGRVMAGILRVLAPLIDGLKRDMIAEFDRRIADLAGASRAPAVDATLQYQPVASHRDVANETSYAGVTKERGAQRNNPPLIAGTASGISVKTVPEPERRLWLYLSRLSPDTVDEQVSDMVCQCLDISDVTVRRLLSKDRDIASVTFLSYKVGIPLSLRKRALDPSTWPNGLLFREFIEKPRPSSAPLNTISLHARDSVSSPACLLAGHPTPSPPPRFSLLTSTNQQRKRPRADNGSLTDDE